MFIFIPAFILGIAGLAMYIIYQTDRKREKPLFENEGKLWGWAHFNMWAGLAFSAIFLIGTLVSYSNDLDNTEELRKLGKVQQIYQERSDNLLKKFTLYLTEYAEFEKEIYDKIGPEQVDFYWVKYPELHNIEAVKLNVAEIKDAQDFIYQTRLQMVDIEKDMHFRRVNPWIIYTMMPDMPAFINVGKPVVLNIGGE